MMSLQIKRHVPQHEWKDFSPLQVMRSAAGYYLGTLYTGREGLEPGSRDTAYFFTEDRAKEVLAAIEKLWIEDLPIHSEWAIDQWLKKNTNHGYRFHP